MATLARTPVETGRPPDYLSGTPRAHSIDRWIYVFTAALFVAIVLTGFVPDSIAKIAAVQAGQRPPFPLLLHLHAVLMASFLLLLLAQTSLVAVGRGDLHVQLGRAAFVIAPALVIVGLVLVPTMYHETSHALSIAAPSAREQLQQHLLRKDNVMLLQLRIGLLFPLFLWIGLRARKLNAGFHKRMMILASATPLGAAIDRMDWLPTSFPASPMATDFYIVAAVSPMFIWDVLRNRRIHDAYLVWFAVNLPVATAVCFLWNTRWWHATAEQLMGL